MDNLAQVKTALSQIDGVTLTANAPMAKYTSFRIGGPADLLVEVFSESGLQGVLQTLHVTATPFFMLGKGSNLLVGDRGIRGIVLKLSGLDHANVEGRKLTAGAGISLARLANVALESALTGLEFASGIPGSLGGAVVMNAGAYDGEMKDVVRQVTAFTPAGEKRVISAEEAHFSYRHSLFMDNGWIVVSALMELEPGDPTAIRATMDDLNDRRRTKQPLEYPSAGSAFKRPVGYYAGALIEQANLKGYAIGGAQISEKHAGFIINRGDATAKDVLDLIHHVQEEIAKTSGVCIEPEIRLVGEF